MQYDINLVPRKLVLEQLFLGTDSGLATKLETCCLLMAMDNVLVTMNSIKAKAMNLKAIKLVEITKYQNLPACNIGRGSCIGGEVRRCLTWVGGVKSKLIGGRYVRLNVENPKFDGLG